MKITDFEEERAKRRPDYISRDGIEDGLRTVEWEVSRIVNGSVTAFDAVDPIAYEIQAYINAIRRIIEA